MDKCFCHLNGYEVKDAQARRDIENIYSSLENINNTIIIDVKDFGAKGDGVTIDSDAIQSALDYIESIGGGILYLPAGTYLLDDSPLIPSNTIFMGTGRNTILKGVRPIGYVGTALISNKGQDATGYNGATNIVIRDLTIDSPTTNGIVINHANNVLIENIYGLSTGVHFIDIASKNVICRDLKLEGTAGASCFQLNKLNGVQTYWKNGAAIAPNYDNTIASSVTLEDSYITTVDNAEGLGRELSVSIHLHRDLNEKLTLKNVYCSGRMFGLFKDTGGKCDDLLIEGCTFVNNTGGIWFDDSDNQSKNLIISNCKFKSHNKAIRCGGYDGVTISNCIIEGDGTNDGSALSLGANDYPSNHVKITNVNVVNYPDNWNILFVPTTSVDVHYSNCNFKEISNLGKVFNDGNYELPNAENEIVTTNKTYNGKPVLCKYFEVEDIAPTDGKQSDNTYMVRVLHNLDMNNIELVSLLGTGLGVNNGMTIPYLDPRGFDRSIALFIDSTAVVVRCGMDRTGLLVKVYLEYILKD